MEVCLFARPKGRRFRKGAVGLARWLRRAAAALLCACLCLTCACSSDPADGSSGASGVGQSGGTQGNAGGASTPVMGYCAYDTLNPYTTVSKLNQELSTLLYDGLYALSPSFEPIERIAVACSTADNKTYTVTLRQGVYFTNGTEVTAPDVEASFLAAKASTVSGWRSALTGVSSCKASADNPYLVTFTVSTPVESLPELLTFPIFQAGSELGTNQYSQANTPSGSGRYAIYHQNGEGWLFRNEEWAFGTVSLERIDLCNIPNDDALEYYMEQGRIDFYYTDLASELLPTYHGEYLSVDLTNIVFLVCNPETPLLDADMRRALSLCIDRIKLSKDAYYSQAKAATGLYSPSDVRRSTSQKLSVNAQTEQMHELMKKMGYEGRDKDGYYITAEGKRMSFSLLVSLDSTSRLQVAQQLSEQLAGCGIELLINSIPQEQYLSAVKDGAYDLYIGEIKLGRNFDLSTLVNVFSTGSGTQTYTAYRRVRSGLLDIPSFIAAAEEEMTVLPLVYRCGVLINNSPLKGLTPSCADPYYNIHTLG